MDVELFEAKEDYPGREGDDSFLPLQKGDVVKVVEKQIVYYVVEKDGRIGKVLKGKMKPYSGGEALQSISNTNQIVSSSSASNLPPISQIKPLSIQNPVSSSQTSLQPLTQRSQSQFGITQSQIVSQLQQGNQGGFVPKQTGISCPLAYQITLSADRQHTCQCSVMELPGD
ncbi:MAG: hypothetical protein EZS28_016005 [Streblomastix strix]|uniref:SH3 domain-containing protein n=1 Tax=Streblomastix strix TaxID=222440 RepID=A0A5J4W1Q0_9EUKA|nr:MAG: hypothetical protein EZS28_016005 [Streblomastix strix]